MKGQLWNSYQDNCKIVSSRFFSVARRRREEFSANASSVILRVNCVSYWAAVTFTCSYCTTNILVSCWILICLCWLGLVSLYVLGIEMSCCIRWIFGKFCQVLNGNPTHRVGFYLQKRCVQCWSSSVETIQSQCRSISAAEQQAAQLSSSFISFRFSGLSVTTFQFHPNVNYLHVHQSSTYKIVLFFRYLIYARYNRSVLITSSLIFLLPYLPLFTIFILFRYSKNWFTNCM